MSSTITRTTTKTAPRQNAKPQHGASAHKSSKVSRVPTDPPPFTLAQIKRAIPPHCFERSLFKSFSYLFVDVAAIGALYYCTQFFEHPAVPFYATCLLWVAYWLMQGFIKTGLWVIAHECGHGAFSDYAVVNDTVGMLGHTFLLVPYWSWKISHSRHHSKTGHVGLDEVFVPQVKPSNTPDEEPSPALTLFRIVTTLTVGWFAYLLFNATGRPYPAPANHFNPYSPIFSPKERKFVLMSDIALLVFISLLGYSIYTYSFWWVFKVYFVPYLHANFWLVFITMLQHTDLKLPHYSGEEWTWLRGALCTVDRDYGILNVFFHHIGDTHVAHHLFSKMPHYHAQEATRAIIPVLGKYYCRDTTPVFKAMWDSTRDCRFVRDSPLGALWYSE